MSEWVKRGASEFWYRDIGETVSLEVDDRWHRATIAVRARDSFTGEPGAVVSPVAYQRKAEEMAIKLADEIRQALGVPSEAERIAEWLEKGNLRDYGLQALDSHDLTTRLVAVIRTGAWRKP